MAKLSPSELARLVYTETGWRGSDLVIAVAIALGESGGDPTIRSKVDKADAKWGVSLGLFQIRPLNADRGRGGPRDETLLADPVHNVRSAFQIYTFADSSFRPWGAYTNGSYKRHLNAARQGVEMAWRLVASLRKLMGEVDAMAPRRSRASDGTIGDSAHSSRKSDHNPEPDGTVDACDITHDPAHGADMESVYQTIVASRDRRVKYIIWRRTITSGNAGPSPWVRRRYSGSNPHDKHMHVSVLDAYQDDTAAWLEEDAMAAVSREEFDKLADKVDDIHTALFSKSPEAAKEAGRRGASVVDLLVEIRNRLPKPEPEPDPTPDA